jgi:hypothetical protein
VGGGTSHIQGAWIFVSLNFELESNKEEEEEWGTEQLSVDPREISQALYAQHRTWAPRS